MWSCRFLRLSSACLSSARAMPVADPFVLTNAEDRIFHIVINRPEAKNCVNHATALQLIDAFEKFEKDQNCDIAIISGAGGSFCAGYDLKEVASGTFPQGDYMEKFLAKHRFLGPTNSRPSKPMIAAVEGFAVAGGLEMSLLADLRVASMDAQFGVLCRRFGVPLIDGGTIRLPRAIGMSRAMDMILTGRLIDAQTAHDWGLVNRLAPKGEAKTAAVALAKEILQHPQRCLRADRASAYFAAYDADGDFERAFEFELENGMPVLDDAVRHAGRFVRKEHLRPSDKPKTKL